MAGNSVVFFQKDITIPTKWIDLFVSNDIYFKVVTTSSGLSNIESPDVVILDISHHIDDKFDTISWIKNLFSDTEIILLTPIEHISEAVETVVSRGAFLYLPKPVKAEILIEVVKKAIKSHKKNSELISYEDDYFEKSLNSSKSMDKILKTIKKIAPTDASILVTGESGTGKEVLSKFIHSRSGRRDENFIAVNSGAIPENLLESELFGHNKGSFTGADKDKKGLIEVADNGTLFLDEIGELPLNMQVKLLRFLQEKTFRRVGDTAERYSNVRIISATNKNLKKMVESGKFREDLYYRLNVFNIELLPLRERKESIPSLINNFLIKYNTQYNKNISIVEQSAMMALANYNFPGNIRELENIIEHSIVLSNNNSISLSNFPQDILNSYSDVGLRKLITDTRSTIDEFEELNQEKLENIKLKSLKEIEIEYIYKILDLCENNHTKTSKILGISRATLWRKLKENEL